MIFYFWLGVNWLVLPPALWTVFAVAIRCLSSSAGDVAAGHREAAGETDCARFPADFWPQAGRGTPEGEGHREAQPALHQGHEWGCQVQPSVRTLRDSSCALWQVSTAQCILPNLICVQPWLSSIFSDHPRLSYPHRGIFSGGLGLEMSCAILSLPITQNPGCSQEHSADSNNSIL